MNKFTSLLVAACMVLILTNCGSEKKSDTTTEASAEESIREIVAREFEYPIPTSFEVTSLIQDANAGFVLGITNDVDNADKYITEYNKALNLGIYGADLSYATTYNRQQETMQFLKASRSLVEDLNISGAFNTEMAERIESNIENKDSLITIVTESFYNTYSYLNENGQDKLSLLVVSGSVIEGLYITTQLLISSGYDAKLVEAFAQQKETVKKLELLLDQFSDDPNINRVLPKIRYISLFFDGVGEAEMTEGQIDDVSASIEETRNEIVAG